MNSDRVRLRDVILADADLLDSWKHPNTEGAFNDFGLPSRPTPRDVLTGGPLRNEHNGQLIVEVIEGRRPIGTVSWHRVMYGPNPESAAWNIGISLIPEARGKGYGTEAQRQVAAYLFETTDVNRVEASTDVDNLAEQRSLEKAGYRREGVQRGAQYRAGRFHDLITYSRTRDDPA
jgi:RimJ/RimL family protein N-acetyltransferase